LFQTAAVTKRLAKPAEVLVSIDGSPVMTANATNSMFVVPVDDNSQVSDSVWFVIVQISHDDKCDIATLHSRCVSVTAGGFVIPQSGS